MAKHTAVIARSIAPATDHQTVKDMVMMMGWEIYCIEIIDQSNGWKFYLLKKIG